MFLKPQVAKNLIWYFDYREKELAALNIISCDYQGWGVLNSWPKQASIPTLECHTGYALIPSTLFLEIWIYKTNISKHSCNNQPIK